MTKLEDVVPIIFPPGYFGHYLYWVLNNCTELGNHLFPELPFKKSGSSHLMNIGSEPSWKEYIDSNQFNKLSMIHQSTTIDENTETLDDVNILSNSVKQCIVINPNDNFYIASTDMEYEKTKPEYSAKMMVSPLVRQDINWETAHIFEIREFLSYKLFHIINFSNSNQYNNNVFSIEIVELLYDFEKVFNNLLIFLNTNSSEKIETIIKNHNSMLCLQHHLTKDTDIKYFLNCFEQNIDCDIPKKLTVIDEAYIQKYLRDKLNLEIKCHNLEVFPQSTTELHKIIYPAEEMIRLE